MVSLDPERTWFRYHHLFADLLRLELRRRRPEEVPVLHRRAAEWFTQHGQVAEAVRHTQAAGDWPGAARLLADHSFSLTLDGQAQTIRALLRAFPPGADHRELAVVRAGGDLLEGRLDEAAAHLAVAERHAETAPPGRRRPLRMAVASLKLSLARRRGNLADVTERAKFLASPVSGQSDEDIALGSDLRAVALMNLGTAEAWTLGLPDAERHLQEGAALAREIGRPYLEVACLAQLAFASRIRLFATTRQRCHEAIALAERHGWGAEPVIAPALVTLAANLVWTGEFDEAERWLQRTRQALQTDTGPDIGQRLHLATGRLYAGRGRHREALEEISAAERLQSQMEGLHAQASQVTGWMLATQARAGLSGEARARLAALDEQEARSGEVRNADAVICLAEGEPAAALSALASALDGTAPAMGYTTVMEAHLLAGLAHRRLGEQRAANQAVEHALALAEQDRVVLPFLMTGSAELLETLPRLRAHAALLADILDLVHGSSLVAKDQSAPPPRRAQPGRAQGTAVSSHEPVPARDRQRAVRLAEHGQHANPQHLRQARCRRSLRGGPTCPRAAASRSRPRLALRSPDAGGSGAAQGDGGDERPAGLDRCRQPLGQAQDAAVAGFGEQPAEQGHEDGGDGGGAVDAQDQRPRCGAPGGEGGPHGDRDRAEHGPGEVPRGRAAGGLGDAAMPMPARPATASRARADARTPVRPAAVTR